MKKSFLFLLISIMTVFLIAGCADDTTSNNGGTGNNGGGSVPSTNTPVDPAKPETLNGNYEVTFFGSEVTNVRVTSGSIPENTYSAFYISNDCAKATELFPDVIGVGGKNGCTTDGQSTLLDGTVLITVSATDMNITSRMQMEGGSVDMSPTDKYQYTVYYNTSDLVTFKGKGVKGWNYDNVNNRPSATATGFPESPYTVTVNTDGTVRIDMTLANKDVSAFGVGTATVDAKNTIILKKINDDTTPLENKIMKQFTTK